MNIDEARVVMEITAHPKWAALESIYNARLYKVHETLETASVDKYQKEQGRAEEIRYLLGLRKRAEKVIESHQTR